MLTPDRAGHRHHHRRSTRGPRYKIRQLESTSATTTARRSSPSAAAARLREMLQRAVGRLLQPRRAHQGPAAPCGRSTATPATRTSRPSPRPSSTRSTRRSTSSSRSGAGPLVHFERIEIKGNTKTRDKVIRREMEMQEGQLFSETRARAEQAPHHGARLLRARRRLDRAGLGARQADHQLRGHREAHRHVPGRRRLQLDRELHRHRAGPAGQPLRQRPVARAAGAGLGACGSS